MKAEQFVKAVKEGIRDFGGETIQGPVVPADLAVGPKDTIRVGEITLAGRYNSEKDFCLQAETLHVIEPLKPESEPALAS